MSSSTSSATQPRSDRAGRWWLAGMGLSLAIAGCIFSYVLWLSYQRAMTTRHWTETPCRIVSSIVLTERPTPHSPLGYRADVEYEYTFGGTKYVGTHIRQVEGPTLHKENADELVENYPKGANASCYVNPKSPSQAVLQHFSKAALYTIWFPILFVIGGGVMAWRAVTGNGSSKLHQSEEDLKP